MQAVCCICGQSFERSPKHLARVSQPTCSRQCRGILRRKPKVSMTCQHCGKEFERYPSQVVSEHSFCSKACFSAWWSDHASGWISGAGYHYISVDGREVFEHRYVMEQHLGRPLLDFEAVHHINGDTLDNRLENLEVMTISRHTIHHNTGKSRKGQKRPPLSEEAKRKISEANKGRPVSDEAKKKISESMKRTRSEKFWSSR